MMYSLERLRRLLTFDQISFFLIAEISLGPSLTSLRYYSTMPLKAMYKNFDTKRFIKNAQTIYQEQKHTTFVRTPAYRSFTFRPV